MYILGIHDGHNCGATIIKDGVILASVCEERLARTKNEVGYPSRSIDDVLKISCVTSAEIDAVVYASLFMHSREHLTDIRPWYKVGLSEQKLEENKPTNYGKILFDQRKHEREQAVVEHLGIDEEKIHFVEHHLAHLAAAYYTNPKKMNGAPVLGLTCDGAGDNLSATVSICRGTEIERIASTSRHASLGKIYSRVTMLMGMNPWEHEYKLMGLAPYADIERSRKASEIFRDLLEVDTESLEFKQRTELSMNYIYEHLVEAFKETRFDVIAGSTQLFTEELLLEWLQACIKKTGIGDIVCGGGVFMNVKANMEMANLDSVNSMYVMPSSGDESLSIGAALHHYYAENRNEDFSKSAIDNLYFGDNYSLDEELGAIEKLAPMEGIQVTKFDDMEKEVALRLSTGKVVAQCAGRMEWGARSLGNRSILCSANDYMKVDYINLMIKNRDFWMPFAPAISEDSEDMYLEKSEKVQPWFMTFAYSGNSLSASDLAAASHPRDKTLRPQVVTKKANPRFHSILTKYKELTGMGGVLNTSFNLHGEPIVYSPTDAVRVFLESDLDCLALNCHLIERRR